MRGIHKREKRDGVVFSRPLRAQLYTKLFSPVVVSGKSQRVVEHRSLPH